MTSWERTGSKIGPRQLERQAVVYVRQSTMGQVVRNTESTRLQYGLVDRAVALGWKAARVMVIDDDLGRSGAGSVDRPGFQRLVTEISLGHVGLVVGIDMSRLARSGRDWYQLVELCALTGALLADSDGVYDPGEYNDRLLLGLKGTMSQAELHLIKQRMQAGRASKARRGEMAIALPIGYWRRPSGDVMLDPDEQVQTVVRLIFAKFVELGSIQGVMRYLVEHGIAVGKRLQSGPDKGQVAWIRPARATVTCMLNSPIYAGIYAYGRRRVDPTGQRPGHPQSGLRRRDPDEWIAKIEDALPAYISVGQYQANLARLAANKPHADTPGAVRFGPALLTGLLRCGRCRRRMTVCYHVDAGKPRTSYNCTGARAEYGGPVCQRMSGRCIDQAVTAAVLEALTPAAVQVSLHAIEQVHTDRARLEQLWRQRLERAQITVDRARRCYQLVEPENRLVARQLEATWEKALTDQRHLIEDHDRFCQATPPKLTDTQRAAITAAAHDLPRVWQAPTTTNADRKEIIRSVIDEIVVHTQGRSELVDLTLTWAGGQTSQACARRPLQRLEDLSYYPQLVARIGELSEAGLTPEAIVIHLRTEGYRHARGDHDIGRRAVEQVLLRTGHTINRSHQPRRVHPDQAPQDNERWLADLAAELGVTLGTIHRWRQQGRLAGRQETYPPHRWILHADPTKLAELRTHLDRVRGRATRVHPRFTEAADHDTPAQSA
jgi:DNA invertase Pin-like site-specific DNA recombinase